MNRRDAEDYEKLRRRMHPAGVMATAGRTDGDEVQTLAEGERLVVPMPGAIGVAVLAYETGNGEGQTSLRAAVDALAARMKRLGGLRWGVAYVETPVDPDKVKEALAKAPAIGDYEVEIGLEVQQAQMDALRALLSI